MSDINLTNCQKLVDFLVAEHEGFEFDMGTALTYKPEEAANDEFHRPLGELFERTPTPSVCGSAGCIAGSAFLLWMSEATDEERKNLFDQFEPFNGYERYRHISYPWEIVRDTAATYLGLTPDSPLGMFGMGYDLFKERLAPRECTPLQAAEAVGRVMAGQKPWPDAPFVHDDDDWDESDD